MKHAPLKSPLKNSHFSFKNMINQPKKSVIFLIALLILVCLYNLLSPPISVTIMRQTLTAMLTNNFVKEGFSLKGLYLNIAGNGKFTMVNEFPIYNFIVGLLFKTFNSNPFWGKLVSLSASIITLITFQHLVRHIRGDFIAFLASLFFIIIPVDVLIFTSFQPDALGVMFLMLSLLILNKWRSDLRLIWVASFSITLLLSGLCKYPLLVPYIPICIIMYFFPQGKFRFPKIIELLVPIILFVIPLVSWYLYRETLTDPSLLSYQYEMFLIGDLSRFLSFHFYINPIIMLIMLVTGGSGIIYFLFGLQKSSAVEWALLLGIPLYYLIIPTAAFQYYYLYAIGPIVALFMAKGSIRIFSYCKKRHIIYLSHLLCISFFLSTVFGISYTLRMDKVSLSASKAMQQISKPKDLFYIINMHDRACAVGGNNTSLLYLSNRKGWNISCFDPHNPKIDFVQIDAAANHGVKWLLVTWYTPSVEPWYSIFLPDRFKRSPPFDTQAMAKAIEQRYPIKYKGKNFAILALSPHKLDKQFAPEIEAVKKCDCNHFFQSS